MAERPLTDWNTGLFDCFEDPKTCCFGCWCTPCMAYTVTGRLGENSLLPFWDIFLIHFGGFFAHPAALSMRLVMRNKYGIKGSLNEDIAISSFCAKCSWCQMHRELKHRQQNPDIINRQTQSVVNTQPAALQVGAVGQTGIIQASR